MKLDLKLTSVVVPNSPCGRACGSVSSSQGLISSAATSSGIVVVAGEVALPEFLDPLQELEVILHLALHEALSRDSLYS